LARAQLTFTVVNTGGLVTSYTGPQTYFRVVNALPTPTPYCQFTPVTKPSADSIMKLSLQVTKAVPSQMQSFLHLTKAIPSLTQLEWPHVYV